MISFPALPNDPLGLEPGVRYLFDDSIAADFLKMTSPRTGKRVVCTAYIWPWRL